MWRRGWCTRRMRPRLSSDLRSRSPEIRDDSAELRSRGALAGGDCISLAWAGVRARAPGAEPGTFRSTQEIVFGVGAEERVLEDRNWALFLQLLTTLRDARHPYGPRAHPLFRMHPERWLESLVVRRCQRDRRAPGTARAVFAGSGVFGGRSRHDRCAHGDARRPAGGGGIEGGRGYPSAAAGAGLLVTGGVASCARRVSEVWIF